ncbi:MAG: GNAT family N-acetyltransferase [Alphaproteobacteria bacterium]
MAAPTETEPGTDARFRPATRADARDIALFYRMASDGVSDYVWSLLAEPGEDLLDVGARRYERENTDFSYQNCEIAELDGKVAGMLFGYSMGPPEPDAEPVDDPVLKPYAELELPNSFYISGIAIQPELRSTGIGSALLARAHRQARADGYKQASLIALSAMSTRSGFTSGWATGSSTGAPSSPTRSSTTRTATRC